MAYGATIQQNEKQEQPNNVSYADTDTTPINYLSQQRPSTTTPPVYDAEKQKNQERQSKHISFAENACWVCCFFFLLLFFSSPMIKIPPQNRLSTSCSLASNSIFSLLLGVRLCLLPSLTPLLIFFLRSFFFFFFYPFPPLFSPLTSPSGRSLSRTKIPRCSIHK